MDMLRPISSEKKIVIHEKLHKKKINKYINLFFLEKIKIKKREFKYKKFFKRIYILKEKINQNQNIENRQYFKINKKILIKK
jgi:hypothetical protein